MSYKNFLAYLLTLLVGLSLTACPDDECADDLLGGDEGGADVAAGGDECLEGGAGGEGGADMGGEGGEGGAGGAETTAYRYIVIVDETEDVNDDGTPGIDVCEVDIICDGLEAAIDLENSALGSDDCDGSNGENCICRDAVEGICGGTDRGDLSLAYNGNYCDTDDDYVSLGIGGVLTFDLGEGNDANGCNVDVFEKSGTNEEIFSVYACADADLNDCIIVEGGVMSVEENNFVVSTDAEE